MIRFPATHRLTLALAALSALAAGCGTTKWSDSPRTATEQLLVSDAVDRAISEIDFTALADKDVYLDTRYIVTALDQNYVVSTMRQHMLASGCIIKDKPEDADYIVEVRSGSLGTNRQDLLFGVPATNLPTAGLLPVGSAAIPEIALMKRTNQQAVCKIAVFAYDRMTGRPVWQSGNRKIASRAKDSWFLGAGPFQKGTIYDGTAFAGEKLAVPLIKNRRAQAPQASVGVERTFNARNMQFAEPASPPNTVNQAGYTGAAEEQAPAPLPAAPATSAPPKATPPPAAETDAAAEAKKPDPEQSEKPAKPAYTPPLPPATPPPAQPAPGLQGPLAPQAVLAPANPAAATAGALQTFSWAKELLEREQQ
jgi:hypothetical protein